MDAKFCKDCKFYDPGIVYPRCTNTRIPARNPDPVTGEQPPAYCNVQRLKWDPGVACGESGDWFEPKAAA